MTGRALRALERSGATRRDAALAAAVGALFLVEIFTNSLVTGPLAVNLAVVVAMSAPLAWRRTRPFAVLCVIVGTAVVTTIVATSAADLMSTFVAVLAAAFAVAAYAGAAQAMTGLVFVVAAVVVIDVIGHDASPGNILVPSMIFTAGWAAGRIFRSRAKVTRELEERAGRLERERAELAQTAVDEERARIARELHDVVAHSVSVMVVQAGAARRVLGRSPQESLAALGTVEATGREALAELRRTLGMLRPEGTPPDLAPQPRLARDLPGLAERARAAGLPVDVHVTGTPRPLPAGVDLAAYRIVQEALTNTLKHAGPAHATVSVAWGDEDLALEIRDTGRGPAPNGRVAGSGLGLLGMHERVALVGGHLEAGPTRGGGFRVRATLPQESPTP